MFSFKVDNEISIELLQQHHKNELFELIDTNREHLRKWLLWVDKRKSAEDLEAIIPIWIKTTLTTTVLMQELGIMVN